jgi:hypothetical protein
LAECIVFALRARGVVVSEADRERILSCKDEELLDGWFGRVFSATSVDELWDAGDRLRAASSVSAVG